MASPSNRVASAVPFSAADLASLKDNPYVQRVIQDTELRDNVTNAIQSGRGAYTQLVANGAPHKAVLEDSKLHDHVSAAAKSVRDVALALNEVSAKPPKKHHRGLWLLILLLTAFTALALSESLRNKLLDALFGKEEEFQYTPPAPAASEPPSSPVSAA